MPPEVISLDSDSDDVAPPLPRAPPSLRSLAAPVNLSSDEERSNKVHDDDNDDDLLEPSFAQKVAALVRSRRNSVSNFPFKTRSSSSGSSSTAVVVDFDADEPPLPTPASPPPPRPPKKLSILDDDDTHINAQQRVLSPLKSRTADEPSCMIVDVGDAIR